MHLEELCFYVCTIILWVKCWKYSPSYSILLNLGTKTWWRLAPLAFQKDEIQLFQFSGSSIGVFEMVWRKISHQQSSRLVLDYFFLFLYIYRRYQVTTTDIKLMQGTSLLRLHNDSLRTMLKGTLFCRTVYFNWSPALIPDFEWVDWNFKGLPNGYWLDPQNQRLAVHNSFFPDS